MIYFLTSYLACISYAMLSIPLSMPQSFLKGNFAFQPPLYLSKSVVYSDEQIFCICTELRPRGIESISNKSTRYP